MKEKFKIDESKKKEIKAFVKSNVKIISVILLIILLLAILGIVKLVTANNANKLLAAYYSSSLTDGVEISDEGLYLEQRDQMMNDIINTIANFIYSDEDLRNAHGKFSEAQINKIIDYVTKDLYPKYENLMPEDSFRQLIKNIIDNNNEFENTDDFIEKMKNYININCAYNTIKRLIKNDTLLKEDQVLEMVQAMSNNTITDEEIKALVKNMKGGSELSIEDINNLITQLENTANIDRTTLNRIIQEVSEQQNIKNEEINNIINKLENNTQLNYNELNSLIDILKNEYKMSDSQIKDIISELKNSSETEDGVLKGLISKLESQTETNITDLKNETDTNINNLKTETNSQISDIKSKQILVGDYDDTTNTLTIEQATWDTY